MRCSYSVWGEDHSCRRRLRIRNGISERCCCNYQYESFHDIINLFVQQQIRSRRLYVAGLFQGVELTRDGTTFYRSTRFF